MVGFAGMTPLMVAAYYGHAQFAEALLSKGAFVNNQNAVRTPVAACSSCVFSRAQLSSPFCIARWQQRAALRGVERQARRCEAAGKQRSHRGPAE